MIGEGIVLTVVAVTGTRIKLGIEAPQEMSIRREEIPAEPKKE